jgi:hypothetical protein
LFPQTSPFSPVYLLAILYKSKLPCGDHPHPNNNNASTLSFASNKKILCDIVIVMAEF